MKLAEKVKFRQKILILCSSDTARATFKPQIKNYCLISSIYIEKPSIHRIFKVKNLLKSKNYSDTYFYKHLISKNKKIKYCPSALFSEKKCLRNILFSCFYLITKLFAKTCDISYSYMNVNDKWDMLYKYIID